MWHRHREQSELWALVYLELRLVQEMRHQYDRRTALSDLRDQLPRASSILGIELLIAATLWLVRRRAA